MSKVPVESARHLRTRTTRAGNGEGKSEARQGANGRCVTRFRYRFALPVADGGERGAGQGFGVMSGGVAEPSTPGRGASKCRTR